MFPVINVGGLSLHGYAFGLVGVAAAVVYAALMWKSRLKGVLPRRHFVNIVLITCLAGELGCRLLGALVAAPGAVWPTDPAPLPAFFGSLLSERVYYGTPLLAVACLAWYDHHYGLPHADTFALVMPGLALFHAVARVGCCFAGCCYGIPLEFGLVLADGVARFPVQLVESACNLVLFAILHVIVWHRGRRYLAVPLYFIGYGIVRFALEFLRGDAVRGFFLGISTSQWIALITILAAALYLARCSRPRSRSPHPKAH